MYKSVVTSEPNKQSRKKYVQIDDRQKFLQRMLRGN